MNETIVAAGDKRDIPLHTFKRESDSAGEAIPFEHLSFAAAPSLAQATFPHRHNFYEILYVTDGVGTHYIDSQAYPIRPNTFYFISPGQVHYWETTTPLQGEIFIFTEDFLLLAPADYMVLREFSFFHTVAVSPVLQLTPVEHDRIAPLYRSIAIEFATRDFRAASVLRAYLHILLVQLQRICADQEANAGAAAGRSAQHLTRQFKQLVAEQFAQTQSVQTYAEQLGVSNSHLSKTVKAATGYTPGKLIRQEIVLEAKRLFQHTDLTANEVSYRLGFEDPSYFGRFFKREVGMSPGQFRRGA